MNDAPFLTQISRRPEPVDETSFPWTLPLLRRMQHLGFSRQVTLLVGENGSGKSTLLEGLAAGMDAVAVGSSEIRDDETLAAARAFAAGFRFARRRHARTRLFLRAEDMFGFSRRISRTMADMRQIRDDLADSLPEGSYGRRLAVGMADGQARALAGRYGEDPDARSHGEAFLAVLRTRLSPFGLYFLDEPETPLSPTRILALIRLIQETVETGSQLVIATHSPILMALPGAEILLIEDGTIGPVAWDEVEHVRITRGFLNDPERYLRQL
jgi:predicted ATPase